MDHQNPKLKAWKSAEQAARSIEREVRNLLLDRAQGELPAGLEDKMAAAVALRAAAHRMLQEALRDVEVAAKALHYRNVTTPTIRPLDATSASSSRRHTAARQNATPPSDGLDGRDLDESRDIRSKSDGSPVGADSPDRKP